MEYTDRLPPSLLGPPVFMGPPPLTPHGSWMSGPPPGPCYDDMPQWTEECWHQGYPMYHRGRHHGQEGHMRGRNGNWFSNRRGRRYRKRKQQKTEPDSTHYCDTCERSFTTTEKYYEHVSQHVECPEEDCEYTAHKKLVKIHWNNRHAPGAKRIKLDTPEEIAKWREERKKNFPTLENIAKKEQMEKEEQG
ncbi:FMR1-interacting protein NUFIP1-like [Discoglossus pictus]